MKNIFIPYFGCKRNEINYIIENLPHHYTKFVDVFGGSGCVGILIKDNYSNIDIIYNDFNEKLIRLINIFKSNDINLEKEINDFNNKLIYSHETFNDAMIHMDYMYNNIILDDLKFLVKCLFTMRNMYLINDEVKIWNLRCDKRKNNGLNTLIDLYRKCIKFDEYKYTYSKLDTILNKDYKDILNNYIDDENVVLYLDPPYIKSKKITYNKSFFNYDDIMYIIDYMKKSKCKVMLHIDYDERYFDDELIIKCVYDKIYNFKSKSKSKSKHVIITNY